MCGDGTAIGLGAAALCVVAGLGFAVADVATGAAAATGSPPRPNHLPIVRKKNGDSFDCTLWADPDVATAGVISGSTVCGGLTFAGKGPGGAFTSLFPVWKSVIDFDWYLARKTGCMPPSAPVLTATVATPLLTYSARACSSLACFAFTAVATS